MAPRLALLTLGATNRTSIGCALERAGGKPFFVESAAELRDAEGIVFPGVANFGYLADEIDRRELREPLLAAIGEGIPFLGICAGFQMLFESSDEQPDARGLGVFAGRAGLLDGPRSPHMGWNMVVPVKPEIMGGWAYFANAYAAPRGSETVAITEYGDTFTSIAQRDAILGAQFHPERSGDFGAQFLANFVANVRVRSAC